MDSKQLKLVCAGCVMNSALTNSAKIQMLEFIKESKDVQLKSLLLDGKIINIDEQAEEIVNDRFKASSLQEGPVGSIMGMLIFTPMLWAAYRAAKAAVEKDSKICGTFDISEKRDKCLVKVKLRGLTQQLSIVKKALGDCPKSKNPVKCKQKGQAAIQKLQKQAQTLKNNYNDRFGVSPNK